LALAIFFLAGFVMAADQPNEAEQAFTKAFRANDVDAIVALYAPDAVLYPPDAMEARGTEAIRASYGGMMSNFSVQEFNITEAHSETHGDVSIGWGKWTLTLAPKAGGEPMHMEGRFTDVSKKIHGHWLYVADHASLPL